MAGKEQKKGIHSRFGSRSRRGMARPRALCAKGACAPPPPRPASGRPAKPTKAKARATFARLAPKWRRPWLQEREGPPWGVGCTLCAALHLAKSSGFNGCVNIPDRLAQHAGFLVYANFEVPALGVINWVRFMEHELVDIKFCYTSLFVFCCLSYTSCLCSSSVFAGRPLEGATQIKIGV